MANDDSPEEKPEENKEVNKLTSAAPKEKSALVEIMQIVIPAISAIAVAYFSYLQITQPKMLEIAATQTAVVVSQAVVPQATSAESPTTIPTAPVGAASALTATVATTPTAPPATESPTPEAAAPTATTLTSNVAASPTDIPTEAPTAVPTTVATTVAAAAPTSVPAAAATSVSTIAPIAGDRVLLTTTEGEQPVALLPESLQFQSTSGLELRSGEWIPFTNLFAIEVGQVRAGVIPVELTFTDGLTQSANVDKDADVIDGETARGTVQLHLAEIKRLEFPNPAQAPLPDLPLVAVLSQTGDTANVIASTLRFQDVEGFNLLSGEYIPFANIVKVNVGQARGGNVPIEITFTDGLTQTASVEQGSDSLEGETVHGTFQRNIYAIEQLQLPNELEPASQSSPSVDDLVTLTTPEGHSAYVIANTLRFQSVEGINLRSGEHIPFANIVLVDVGPVRGGDTPIELTFTDGLTQSARVEQDADSFEGETLHGTFQRNTTRLQRLQLPNQLQSAAALPAAGELVTLTTADGDSAQVIASSLRFQDINSLVLDSGEEIPFDAIRTIVVGQVRAGNVPIEITFTDGATQSATVLKDADIFKGETLHGSYLSALYELKQVDFP